MSKDSYFPRNRLTNIPVTVSPNSDQRFIRFRSSDESFDALRDQLHRRIGQFEDNCRTWRERNLNSSFFDSSEFPSSSLMRSRPRMPFDFPEFPEFGNIDWPTFRGSPLVSDLPSDGTGHNSFIEEDNDGRKKYKIQFDVGQFKPEELKIQAIGRMLTVTGDRQIKAGNTTESKQFNRELTLPDFVEIDNIQSYLSNDGILTVETTVNLDRLYHRPGSSTLAMPNENHIVNTTFTGGRPSQNKYIPNNHNNNIQPNTYSSNSSTSSFRQDSSSLRGSSSFQQNSSPTRNQYSSTSSASTLTGANSINNPQSGIHSKATSRVDHISNNQNGDEKYTTYKFDLSQYTPESIIVQIINSVLKVTAVREERDQHGLTRHEFRREIGLPDGIEAKSVINSIDKNGILTVNIPTRDHRPPLTPLRTAQQFNFPATSLGNESNLSRTEPLRLTFDLSGYTPDDVTVKVIDNVLRISATHIEETNGNRANREYLREYVLPDWVNAENVRAKMSDDSTLTIETSAPNNDIPAQVRSINIT